MLLHIEILYNFSISGNTGSSRYSWSSRGRWTTRDKGMRQVDHSLDVHAFIIESCIIYMHYNAPIHTPTHTTCLKDRHTNTHAIMHTENTHIHTHTHVQTYLYKVTLLQGQKGEPGNRGVRGKPGRKVSVNN